ncbi:MAG: Response regulator receiver [Proteobacteria bacterium]|nr:Response regulator receiver [Pseudomonadota bacterium]
MSRMPWRVLVADDDPTVALLSRAALAGGDFIPTVVDNGNDALTEFRQQAFDIALLDVEMPGLDGFEVCAAIRQSHGAGFPVVLVTGRSDPAFIERTQVLAADYIAKPVNWASLAGLLRTLLEASRV